MEIKGGVIEMPKMSWKLLDEWIVENKHRLIFKPQDGGFSLIDITIANNNSYQITQSVEKEMWTHEELMDYLNGSQDYVVEESS